MSHPLPEPAVRAALLAAGVTDAEIRADVHAGRLVRVAPGTYLDAGSLAQLGIDDQALVRIRAAARRSPALVVSHRSAAALHGLPLLGPEAQIVHFTRAGTGGARRSPHRQVHVARIPDEERMTVDGIHVTTVARTLFDMARSERMQSAVVVADAALRSSRVDGPTMQLVLDGHRGDRGHPRAVRAIGMADGRSESPGETLTRLALQAPGIPALELQPTVFDDKGAFVGRPDFGIPECGVLVEFDGRSKYTSLLRPGQSVTDVVLTEKCREERLTELGWLVIRVVWSDLTQPGVLADRVARACSRRRGQVDSFGLRGSIRPAPPLRF